ncbi:TIGR00725 family protein [Polaromonas sp. YR568]|uniref:TIGR00725 family protein n=1 Tax=Polaromonas sp. YR568 TaxID=1855301 RepID=UPI00398BF2A4
MAREVDISTLLSRQAGTRRFTQPIGMIGPGEGGIEDCEAAYAAAQAFARAGLHVICGGRGGVMKAASAGARAAGGVVVGILPEDDIRAANPYLTVAIATGMGEMRNALIARSSLCLVAIGGGIGTLSEIALGLKWGKRVFALNSDADLPGMIKVESVNELIDVVLEWLAAHP